MMRLSLLSIGKLKDGHELALLARYQDRIAANVTALGFSKLETREFSESRAKTSDLRKRQEANDLLKATASVAARVVLDERGTQLTSRQFATWLGAQRDDGVGSMAFMIGGPDGHDDSVRGEANKIVSLSALTLPHGLARIIFVEQLYRAMTILGGHPYHRD